MKLLATNPGFPSRFPREFTFDFHDYTESQLCRILLDMTKAKGYRFESIKKCGVPIAKVLSRRIHRGANLAGFGNARLVEKCLDQCKITQKARLGAMLLHGVELTTDDYKILKRVDTVGDRPRLEENSYYKELQAMVGLDIVKISMKALLNLQLQNYDSELRGESVQKISLHRVFFGNPGTGELSFLA